MRRWTFILAVTAALLATAATSDKARIDTPDDRDFEPIMVFDLRKGRPDI